MTILWSCFQSAATDGCCSEGCLRRHTAHHGETREEIFFLTGAREGESPRRITNDGTRLRRPADTPYCQQGSDPTARQSQLTAAAKPLPHSPTGSDQIRKETRLTDQERGGMLRNDTAQQQLATHMRAAMEDTGSSHLRNIVLSNMAARCRFLFFPPFTTTADGNMIGRPLESLPKPVAALACPQTPI